ncbi:MAG: glycosyltransferase [Candidatus Thorarchaeota archaeon]
MPFYLVGLNEMKILHLSNVACVAYTIAKYQRKLGHEALLVDHIRSPVRKLLYSGLDEPYYKKVGQFAGLFEPLATGDEDFDIVHVHSQDHVVSRIKRTFPRMPVVLTYHGTDIRNRWNDRQKEYENADLVTVSTIDLLEGASEDTMHIPNPVDTEHFRREADYLPNSALYVWQRTKPEMALSLAKEEAAVRSLILRVQQRNETVFPYLIYPRVLELFEYVIDIKESHGRIIPSLSLTGLQSLALKCKVIHRDDVLSTFPKVHGPLTVAETWISQYEQLL